MNNNGHLKLARRKIAKVLCRKKGYRGALASTHQKPVEFLFCSGQPPVSEAASAGGFAWRAWPDRSDRPATGTIPCRLDGAEAWRTLSCSGRFRDDSAADLFLREPGKWSWEACQVLLRSFLLSNGMSPRGKVPKKCASKKIVALGEMCQKNSEQQLLDYLKSPKTTHSSSHSTSQGQTIPVKTKMGAATERFFGLILKEPKKIMVTLLGTMG